MLERQKKHLSRLQKQNKLEEIVVKSLYIIFFVLYNLFEIYLVYLIGKYQSKVYETVAILMFFFINKAMFGRALHFKSSLVCLGVSLLTFYTAITLTFNFSISILSSVLIGILSGAITSYIASYLYDETKKLTNRKKIIKILNNDTSQENICHVCKIRGLKEDIADTIDLYLTNTKEEVASILNVDTSTVTRRIQRFIKGN